MEVNLLPYLKEIILLLEKKSVFNKEILSFSEACSYLNISSSFLYKLTSERKIPYYIPNGKKIYFRKSELDFWATKNRLDSVNGYDID